MRPVRVTVTGAGVSRVINPDYYMDPFAIGVGCVISSGATVSYTVQHTFDDVYALTFDASTATWFPNSGITSKTANTDGNYAFPVAGIRLNVASSDGTVTMTLIQANTAF